MYVDSVGAKEGGGGQGVETNTVFPSWEAEKGDGSCLKMLQRSFGMEGVGEEFKPH